MSADVLVTADGEGRVLLGSLAQHQYYLADVDGKGIIRLTPAVVIPAHTSRGWEPPAEKEESHPFEVGPPKGEPWWDEDGREVAPEGVGDGLFISVTSKCRCGRAIVSLTAGGPWSHCD